MKKSKKIISLFLVFIMLLTTMSTTTIANASAGRNTKSSSSIGAAMAAGTFWIPGVGEVVITVTGVILVGGIAIKAGSAMYDKIMNYLSSSSGKKQNDYQDAKNKGEKTDNHSTQTGGSLPTNGEEEYSSKDLKTPNGELKQRRYYGKDGKADMDIDYRHGGNGKEPFPHRHDWNNGERGGAYWTWDPGNDTHAIIHIAH